MKSLDSKEETKNSSKSSKKNINTKTEMHECETKERSNLAISLIDLPNIILSAFQNESTFEVLNYFDLSFLKSLKHPFNELYCGRQLKNTPMCLLGFGTQDKGVSGTLAEFDIETLTL